MTHKDYEKFAAMLKAELAPHSPYPGTVRHMQVTKIIMATADIFAKDNPRFDRDKFYKACGLKTATTTNSAS